MSFENTSWDVTWSGASRFTSATADTPGPLLGHLELRCSHLEFSADPGPSVRRLFSGPLVLCQLEASAQDMKLCTGSWTTMSAVLLRVTWRHL